jgi:protein-disulfide isomerase
VTTNKGSLIAAAVGGGIVGAVLVGALGYAAAPQLVRQAIISKPEMLVDAQQALHNQQFEPVLAANKAALETPFGSSWKGASRPTVTMAYFYDYACGYCRRSNPDIERLLKEDKGLRVVYHEFPILGPNSVAAARVSLAASKAGRFAQFHDTMYDAGQPSTEAIAMAGEAVGVTPEQAKDPAIEAELEKNYRLAGQLGATGTPLFVVGNRVINSAVGYEALKEAVSAARAKG